MHCRETLQEMYEENASSIRYTRTNHDGKVIKWDYQLYYNRYGLLIRCIDMRSKPNTSVVYFYDKFKRIAIEVSSTLSSQELTSLQKFYYNEVGKLSNSSVSYMRYDGKESYPSTSISKYTYKGNDEIRITDSPSEEESGVSVFTSVRDEKNREIEDKATHNNEVCYWTKKEYEGDTTKISELGEDGNVFEVITRTYWKEGDIEFSKTVTDTSTIIESTIYEKNDKGHWIKYTEFRNNEVKNIELREITYFPKL